MKNYISKNRVQTGTFEVYDVELEVEYYAEEGEPQTYDYPGSPNTIDIYQVKHFDVDVTDILGEHILADLEQQILEYEFES